MRETPIQAILSPSTNEITFTSLPDALDRRRILGIWNLDRNGAMLYNPSVAGYGGTVAGNVLTVDIDCSAMGSGDELMIFYEGTWSEDTLSKLTSLLTQTSQINGKTPSLDGGKVPVNDADAIAHLFNILNYLINVDSKLAALGPAFKIGSMPVTLSPDDPAVVALGEVHASPTANTVLDRLKTIGAKDFATSAKQDTGNSALVAVNTSIGTTNTEIGGLTETAPATDTASSGLNGRLQRIAQRITSLIGLFPTSIGPKAKAGALAVTTATDDPLLALIGEVQASPTSNTVLDRLKALLTGTSLAAGSAVIGKVGIDQTTPGTTNNVEVSKLPKASSANTVSAVATATGDIISSNSSRKGWGIQNCGTNPIFIYMKTGASSTVFHKILPGGVSDSDGRGGSFDDTVYTGVVSLAGTSPKYTFYEY